MAGQVVPNVYAGVNRYKSVSVNINEHILQLKVEALLPSR